jgi:hypothetical protein
MVVDYRKHILNFSKIAAPLTDLTKGVVKSKAITWNPESQKAFDTLKYALTHAPILAFPNYSQPFILPTDASHFATGAILSQIRDKKEVVIAYGGRKLSVAEQKNICQNINRPRRFQMDFNSKTTTRHTCTVACLFPICLFSSRTSIRFKNSICGRY